MVNFCSASCLQNYLCSPACPKCGGCQKHEWELLEGEGLPNPAGILQAGRGQPMSLPNYWCRACRVQVEPRNAAYMVCSIGRQRIFRLT